MHTVYETGPFTIDPAQGVLLRDGEPVPLTPKVFDTLLVLVEHPGRVLTRDFLMERIWPDTNVSDTSLTQNIWMLRRTLGEEGFIETVPRRGYRFKAEVRRRVVEDVAPGVVVAEPRAPSPVAAAPVATAQPSRTRATLRAGEAAFLAFVVLASIAWMLRQSHAPAELEVGRVRIRKITTSGHEICSAISPDGRFLVHAENREGMQVLLLRQIGTTHDVELVPPAATEYGAVAFSPDGEEVWFTRFDAAEHGSVWRIPTLGGTPRRVFDAYVRGPVFSPDGSRMAFIEVRGIIPRLIVTKRNGELEKILADDIEMAIPAWTDDGAQVAFVRLSQVILADVHSGALTPLPRWPGMYEGGPHKIVGLADFHQDRFLAVHGREQNAQIHRVRRDGMVAPVTNDFAHYAWPSLSRDRTRLAALQTIETANLWTVDLAGGATRKLTKGLGVVNGRSGVDYLSPDKLVYEADWDLWELDIATTERRQLTESRDAWFLAVDRARGGVYSVTQHGLVRHTPPGGRQVVDSDATVPAIDANGRRMAYVRKDRICVQPLPAGAARCGADGWRPRISPDGSKIFAAVSVEPPYFAILSAETWRILQRIDLPMYIPDWAYPIWTPDGRGIAFSKQDGNAWNVWVRPLDGSPDRRLTRFEELFIYSFAFSPDGRELVVSRGESSTDVVLIENAEAR